MNRDSSNLAEIASGGEVFFWPTFVIFFTSRLEHTRHRGVTSAGLSLAIDNSSQTIIGLLGFPGAINSDEIRVLRHAFRAIRSALNTGLVKARTICFLVMMDSGGNQDAADY